jgi:hypothetical protein
MSKKVKTPLLLRVVRWWFPKLEKMAPPLATRLFVQLFFTPLHYGFPEKEQEWVKKSTGFRLLVNGKEVQGYSWGEDTHPIVVFVHGWAGRSTQFRKFIPVFVEAGFRVIAFDGPAHGKSEGKRTNILEFAQVLEMIFEKLGEPKAIIAHSIGGTVALLGAFNGLRIRKLVNIGSPAVGDMIIQAFLDAVNGTWPTALRFKSYMIKKYGRSFDEFSGLYLIQHIKEPPQILLIHDDADADAPIQHALEFVKVHPQAGLIKTSGLGHTRILKDEGVIRNSLTFIQSDG